MERVERCSTLQNDEFCVKNDEFVLKMMNIAVARRDRWPDSPARAMNFALTMMKFVLQMMRFSFKMTSCAFKMMSFALRLFSDLCFDRLFD